MKKKKVNVSISDEAAANLDRIGSRYEMSGASVIAVAAVELSRWPAAELWQRIGQISAPLPSATRAEGARLSYAAAPEPVTVEATPARATR